jgi:hypothetical protein
MFKLKTFAVILEFKTIFNLSISFWFSILELQMGLDTSYDNISEVLSLLQRYKQKIIVHNGDNYTTKFCNMIYLDVNNKVNIKKNKMN